MAKKILFLDRDGVINKDVSYLYKVDDLEWMPTIFEGLQYATQKGYECIVITNQSGVARGYFTENDVTILHGYMRRYLQEKGVSILQFYYCPHLETATVEPYRKVCNCRKPKPGLLLQAMKDYSVDTARSFMIGDSPRDVEAAEAAGIAGYLFKEGSIADLIKSCIEKHEKEA